MEIFWSLLEPSWRPLGASLRPFGGLLAPLGGLWRALASSWRALGGSWRRLGALGDDLDAFWMRFGGLLEASWRLLEASWRPLGASEGVQKPRLKQLNLIGITCCRFSKNTTKTNEILLFLILLRPRFAHIFFKLQLCRAREGSEKL